MKLPNKKLESLYLKSFLIECLFLALIIVTWIVASLTSTIAFLGMFLVVFFFLSRFLRLLENILHEASHYSLPIGKDKNIIVGNFISSILLCTFSSYRKEHLSHHQHVGSSGDLDLVKKERFLANGSSLYNVFMNSIKFKYLTTYLHPIRKSKNFTPFSISFIVFSLALLICSFFCLFPFVVSISIITLIALSYIFGLQWFRYVSDSFDHGGLLKHSLSSKRSRNHVFKGVFNFFIFPWNDAYHLDHHQSPRVPILMLGTSDNIKT